jgi:ABC-type proline/glycine betaine transport system ATPase subunit
VLQELVENGNTIVVIEHNLDVIKVADYLLDFGPEGGDGGGEIVAVGTPEEVAANPASWTGKYLKEVDLNRRDRHETRRKARLRRGPDRTRIPLSDPALQSLARNGVMPVVGEAGPARIGASDAERRVVSGFLSYCDQARA